MLIIKWIGIIFCITQSAMFSGLNLAYFSIGKLRLKIEVKKENPAAIKILKLREDSNFLLTTILWGNVGINVLLAMLADSVMAGVLAFCFSTFIITFLGEIIPQAYFSRNAMKMGALLYPVLRFYQFLLFPLAKPSALILDKWLGHESILYVGETDLQRMLKLHIDAPESDIDRVEGTGAMNFLAIDDLFVVEEGENIDPKSIIEFEFKDGKPVFDLEKKASSSPMVKKIAASNKKWVILVDKEKEPRTMLDADAFIRGLSTKKKEFDPQLYCHTPIIIKDAHTPLGETMAKLKVFAQHPEDDVIDDDVILYWSEKQKRIITGADLLGRLLRGIVKTETPLK